MGDMADWMTDQAMIAEIMGDDYPRGEACKYCGEEGLEWAKINGRWRLVADGELHTCAEYVAEKNNGQET